MKQSRKPRQGASAPTRSNPAPPSLAEGEPSVAEPVRALPMDPVALGCWREMAEGSLLDLTAAALQGARRPRNRVLSRAEIRRQAKAAHARLTTLLDLAAAALARAAPARSPPPA